MMTGSSLTAVCVLLALGLGTQRTLGKTCKCHCCVGLDCTLQWKADTESRGDDCHWKDCERALMWPQCPPENCLGMIRIKSGGKTVFEKDNRNPCNVESLPTDCPWAYELDGMRTAADCSGITEKPKLISGMTKTVRDALFISCVVVVIVIGVFCAARYWWRTRREAEIASQKRERRRELAEEALRDLQYDGRTDPANRQPGFFSDQNDRYRAEAERKGVEPGGPGGRNSVAALYDPISPPSQRGAGGMGTQAGDRVAVPAGAPVLFQGEAHHRGSFPDDSSPRSLTGAGPGSSPCRLVGIVAARGSGRPDGEEGHEVGLDLSATGSERGGPSWGGLGGKVEASRGARSPGSRERSPKGAGGNGGTVTRLSQDGGGNFHLLPSEEDAI
uniref:Uncharacterized protein n=1 Tax=Chromera velia CCMP2878 TaxID=1169474 RepID=A0A0G4GYZ5_9ALVE|eukprot:Cvel_23970.t1-p1 / transcript=Cvel_23970.t1 / gene=Cvel_23970 / organism=Chromera_velia_CCMP2878 / gene_product=hypothetical protein / transcript_product=hypothetical protein / location=Cvel_scaffold2536:22106-25902(+) / protein_length=387 / sequence_SO=supercontig / SO=protein_coding / is_pseudo=false